MIDPCRQWAIQIDVTNSCPRACSNCTRLIGHVNKPFFMPVAAFRHAVACLRNFLTESPPDAIHRKKVLGVIGGEPLLHPEFTALAHVMRELIPDRMQRGLWTGLNWKHSEHADVIADTFGYINNNQHTSKCLHSPVLVASCDVIDDENERRHVIDACWLQKTWAGSVTPKGMFFCEVAGAFDMVFDGPGGLPVEPDCWNRPLADFQDQINRWCPRCGIPLNLKGRLDSDCRDDVSPTNLAALQSLGSHRRTVLFNPKDAAHDKQPWRYLK